MSAPITIECGYDNKEENYIIELIDNNRYKLTHKAKSVDVLTKLDFNFQYEMIVNQESLFQYLRHIIEKRDWFSNRDDWDYITMTCSQFYISCIDEDAPSFKKSLKKMLKFQQGCFQ